jgi:REP element-mobilizing transposase RayT
MDKDNFDEIVSKSEIDPYLGSQVLLQENIAEIVQNALLFFESQRYFLSAWCVMSNHVHVVVSPIGSYNMSQILHSWKSFTANVINKILNREGPFWAQESFVHLIRLYDYWTKFVDYSEDNPVNANYCKSKSEWRFSSAGQNFKRSPNLEFISPYDLPKVNMEPKRKFPKLEKNGCTYFVTFCLDTTVSGRDR